MVGFYPYIWEAQVPRLSHLRSSLLVAFPAFTHFTQRPILIRNTVPQNKEVCVESVIGIILGGGQGSRLYPLTKYRSKPAVPLGGKYRLIDIPISNCLHAGLKCIYVLTQFNSASLNRHIVQTYRFDAFSTGFVEILAAEQTQDRPDWYQGTADAVRQQLRHLMYNPMDQYLILSGDHLYRMNYRDFIATHRASKARPPRIAPPHRATLKGRREYPR